MQKIARYVLGGFLISAGLYHFINPKFYHALIPDYLPWPITINYLSGTLEVVFGLGIIFTKTPLWAKGTLLLLLAFVPSHVYFIKMGSCIENSLCVPPWVSWSRIVFIHPLLLFWVWWVGLTERKAS